MNAEIKTRSNYTFVSKKLTTDHLAACYIIIINEHANERGIKTGELYNYVSLPIFVIGVPA